MPNAIARKLLLALLPFVGVAAVLLLWSASSRTWSRSLPSPTQTWEAS